MYEDKSVDITVIDMIETAENVWSDSCVAAMTDRDVSR